MKITSSMDCFQDLALLHVFREANTSADWLAKLVNRIVGRLPFGTFLLVNLNLFLLVDDAWASSFFFGAIFRSFSYLHQPQQNQTRI